MTGSPCMHGQITFRWLAGTRDYMLIHGFVALHIWLRWVKQYTQSCSVPGVPNIRMFVFFNFFIAAWFLHLTVYAQRMMYVLSLCPISCMHEVNLYSGNRASGTLLLCHVDPLLSTIPYSFSYRNKYIQPLPIPNLNSLLVLLHLTFLCTHHLHWHSRLA